MFTLFHELLALMGRGLSFFYDLVPSYGLAIVEAVEGFVPRGSLRNH